MECQCKCSCSKCTKNKQTIQCDCGRHVEIKSISIIRTSKGAQKIYLKCDCNNTMIAYLTINGWKRFKQQEKKEKLENELRPERILNIIRGLR